jgi:hypothetical protein
MMRKMDFKQYNFRLINFNHLYTKNIEIKLINDLHHYNLLESKIRSDAKKFLFHHIIHGVCEFLLNDKATEKNVIYFNNTQLENFKILKYYKEEDVLKAVNTVLLKVKKLLPIKVFITNISFEFLSHLLEKNDGRGIEVVNGIRNYINSVNIEKFTFNKVKTFTKKNDLVFLNKEYFNLLKTKQLLIV